MNMNPTELRIGNYITIGDGPFQTSIADLNLMVNSDNHIYHPINLTEGWLTNFGFTKDDNDGYDDFMWYKGIFTLFTCKYGTPNDFTYGILMRYGNPNEYKSGITVKYVHQLQNLYYALNMNELTLSNEYGI